MMNKRGYFMVIPFLKHELRSTGMMKEETVPVPHSVPALSDDDVLPIRGLSHWESHIGRGEIPLSV